MRFWEALKPGDIVDLVAPGFAISNEDLQGAMQFVRSWGLEPRLPKKIFANDVLCSNTDQVRWSYLKKALTADDSCVIWCLRGGYGSIRLLPDLAKLKRPKHTKLVIGISDVTSLSVFLKQNWGWPVLHGPLLDRLGKGAATPEHLQELKKILFGEVSEISFENLTPLNGAARRRGKLEAMVTGGNLITLQSTLALPWQWQTKEQILFFEDIGERGYRIDRVLTHFAQIGLFKNCKAIVFGDFTGGNEPKGHNLVWQVVERFASEMKVPVLKGIESGHDVVQRPLPLGCPAVLQCGPKPKLICHTGVR